MEPNETAVYTVYLVSGDYFSFSRLFVACILNTRPVGSRVCLGGVIFGSRISGDKNNMIATLYVFGYRRKIMSRRSVFHASRPSNTSTCLNLLCTSSLWRQSRPLFYFAFIISYVISTRCPCNGDFFLKTLPLTNIAWK